MEKENLAEDGGDSASGSQNNQKINVTEMVTESHLNVNYDDVK